jgi:nucleotide-binding universal stress UspA family protein
MHRSMENRMSFDPQHILCAVDFSPPSEAVVHAGHLLAQAFDARLSVFHAVTASHDPYPGTAIFERGGAQGDFMAAARRNLNELTAPLNQVAAIVAAGDPVDGLSDCIRGTGAGLVVAARHGWTGIQRVLLGSVVERMARRLTTPLLVVGRTRKHSSDNPPFQKVVMACKTLAPRDPVLAVAAAIARRFDAGLYLLHAMERPVRPDILEPTNGPYGQVQASLQDRLRQEMEGKLRATVGDLGVSVDLTPGPAAEALPGYIARRQADLLVVGVRHHHRLAQLLVGSTTEAALRHAACAVLTVPTSMTREETPGKRWPR